MRSNSAEETRQQGIQLGKSLVSNSVVALFGDLGAGKTTFIKGLAEGAAGIMPQEVSSPTFTYLNIYLGHLSIYHFDLYRLKQQNDFLLMGFDEYFQAGGICCLEWSERIKPLLPKETICVHLTHAQEQTRSITYEKNSFF